MAKLNPLHLTDEERQHPATVKAMMLVTQNTIYAWRHQWREEGLKGLYYRPKSGRPRKSNPEYHRLLEETLETDPINNQQGQSTLVKITKKDAILSVGFAHAIMCRPLQTITLVTTTR